MLPMDNVTLEKVVYQFRTLKFTFGGVWSADNFPKISSSRKQRTFQIVNTASLSQTYGGHWILLIFLPLTFECIDDDKATRTQPRTNVLKQRRRRERLKNSSSSSSSRKNSSSRFNKNIKFIKLNNIIVWNSLNIPFTMFTEFYTRLYTFYYCCPELYVVHEIPSNPPVQSQSSNLCGLYCVYAALTVFECAGKIDLRVAKTNVSEFTLDSLWTLLANRSNNAFRKALKSLNLLNEVELVRYFNKKIGNKFTFVVL